MASRPLTLPWSLFTGHTWSAFKKKTAATAKHPSMQEIFEWLLCARHSLGIWDIPVNKAVKSSSCPHEAYIRRVSNRAQTPSPTATPKRSLKQGTEELE